MVGPSTTSCITIVCVFNNSKVRAECLDRSIADLRWQMPNVEYLPIDNTDGQFSTAGAALNHGASLARGDYIVFAHQDVYLHSLTALSDAVQLMHSGEIGIAGAIGITSGQTLAGKIRDRVVVLGELSETAVDVDSLDEVLFIIAKKQLTSAPLTEDQVFAWHAYAIEYGLRMRSLGKRVVAVDIPITHNSMTVNLARLDEAHGAIAKIYPGVIPLSTTCGMITSPGKNSRNGLLAKHRWRFRWLKDSFQVRRIQERAGVERVVLSDIRIDIDQVLDVNDGVLTVINADDATSDDRYSWGDVLRLVRNRSELSVSRMAVREIESLLAELDEGSSVLVTNIAIGEVETLARLGRSSTRQMVGYHEDLGFWLLCGALVGSCGLLWREKKHTPLRAFWMRASSVQLATNSRTAASNARDE